MAVSKTQNERPAILALIDEAATQEQAVQGLQTQIGNGFTETSVTTQVSQLGDAQAALAEDVFGILAQLENIKFGITPEITVPANDSYSDSYVFFEPFDASAKCFVFLAFADIISQDTLSLALVDSSYSGFSYSITNTDTDPVTVTVGFLAIAAIPLS